MRKRLCYQVKVFGKRRTLCFRPHVYIRQSLGIQVTGGDRGNDQEIDQDGRYKEMRKRRKDKDEVQNLNKLLSLYNS